MIAFLRGRVAMVEPDAVVIDVNGVGYRVNVTAAFKTMLPGNEQEIKVFTHMIVREDDIQLYGFLSPEEISVFTLLLGVNGVGPKAAMAVLSYLSPQGLGRALALEDTSALTMVPGVGKKTAQRILLELKDKFKKFNLNLTEQPQPQVRNGTFPDADDAVAALLALGYSASEARDAVNKAVESGAAGISESIKTALRFLDKTKK